MSEKICSILLEDKSLYQCCVAAGGGGAAAAGRRTGPRGGGGGRQHGAAAGSEEPQPGPGAATGGPGSQGSHYPPRRRKLLNFFILGNVFGELAAGPGGFLLKLSAADLRGDTALHCGKKSANFLAFGLIDRVQQGQ